MRIGQAARVEDEIGVAWYAVLEAERLQHDRHLAGVALGHPRADQFAQLVQGGTRGVDLQAGEVEQRRKGLAFELNRLIERMVVIGQRVTPAGLAEALHQDVVFGIEVHHLTIDPVVAQALDQGGQAVEFAARVAGIDPDRGEFTGLGRIAT